MHKNERPTRERKYNAFFLPKNISVALQTKNGGDMTQYLTIKDLANYLNYSHERVYRLWRTWAMNGLKVYKIGGTPRFRASEVDQWIEKKNRLVSVKA